MQDTLARKLRVLRAERGLTIREAEQLTGVDKDTLSKLERGVRRPYDITLSRLARGYDVPVEALLEEPVSSGKTEAPEESAYRAFSEQLRRAHGAMRSMDVSKQRRAVEQASETVVVIKYADEDISPFEAFAEAARIWTEARRDYEGVLSLEPPHKLTLSDDGECVQIVVEPASESDCT
jgi:transcriptional regulator with XRE-family HTH domain